MSDRVWVAGHPVDSLGPVGSMQDSTVMRRDGWSGDYQASCSFSLRSAALPSWLRRDALYEHRGEGGRTWGGRLSEPSSNGDGTWTLQAYGFGSMLEQYEAMTIVGSTITPTFVPNDALDQAIDDDGPFLRPSSLSGTAVTTLDDKFVSLWTLLQADATAKGKFVHVDSWGVVTYRSFDTAAKWITAPTPDYGGTADENFVSHLYLWYVSSVDGTTGEPNDWAIRLAGPTATRDEIAAQYGRKMLPADVTDRGYLTALQAQALADAMFATFGGRMGYTQGVDLHPYSLRRLGWGPASPLSLYGASGAGSVLRVPGSWDTRSHTTALAHWDLPLGEVTRVHDEQRTSVTPFGFEARDFMGVTVATTAAAKASDSRRLVGGLNPR